jgi:hypothetical protein
MTTNEERRSCRGQRTGTSFDTYFIFPLPMAELSLPLCTLRKQREGAIYSSSRPILGTRWKWMVSFTLRFLYLQRMSSTFSLKWRKDGLQRQGGRLEEQNKFLLVPEIKTFFLRCPACTPGSVPATSSILLTVKQ